MSVGLSWILLDNYFALNLLALFVSLELSIIKQFWHKFKKAKWWPMMEKTLVYYTPWCTRCWWCPSLSLQKPPGCTYAFTHTCTPTCSHTAKTHTQPHTVPYVSTDIMERLLSYLHCGDPPSAGPSPVWWLTCGIPRGLAPSLPHPVGPFRAARWKTPHYLSESDLPGKDSIKLVQPSSFKGW